jgi:hypothetical protein
MQGRNLGQGSGRCGRPGGKVKREEKMSNEINMLNKEMIFAQQILN